MFAAEFSRKIGPRDLCFPPASRLEAMRILQERGEDEDDEVDEDSSEARMADIIEEAKDAAAKLKDDYGDEVLCDLGRQENDAMQKSASGHKSASSRHQ